MRLQSGARLPESGVSLKRALSWSFDSPVGPLTLLGYSRAADATAFAIPELSWLFDAGTLVSTIRPEHVWISHTHSDHVHMLTHVKSRRKPPHFHLPEHAVGLVEAYLQAAQQMTHNRHFDEDPDWSWETSHHYNPLEPGMQKRVKRGQTTLVVDVVRCDHSVPALGYYVQAVKSKLREEFVGMPGHEIGKLRASGVAVTEEQRTPMLAYLFDTTTRVFEEHPEVLDAPIIITECTFLFDEHEEHAARTKHTHWSRLAPIVREYADTTFILGHVSWRYNDAEIRDFFTEHGAENVMVWAELNGQQRGVR